MAAMQVGAKKLYLVWTKKSTKRSFLRFATE